jgi:hypothetical protein
MADLELIENSVISNLSNVTELKQSFPYEPTKLPVLPAITMFFDGFRQEDSSSRRKRVNWRWVLRVYVTLRDAEKAQRDIKSLMVAVRKELAKDPTLAGSCLYHNILSGDVYVDLDQNNPHLMAEMTLEATTDEGY